MEHGKRRNVYVKLLFAVVMVLLVWMMPSHIMAKSWTEDASQSIYNNNAGTDMSEKTEEDEEEEGEGEESEEEKEPSKIEQWISGVIISLADGINSLFEELDMSLDKVICGRVGSGGMEVALFSFELVEGNPYGTIAAVIYSAMRSIVFVIMAIILIAFLTKASYSSGNSSARAKLKESLSNYLMIYGLLFMMPYLLDLWLYIRDLLLYALLGIQDNFMQDMAVLAGSGRGSVELSLVGHYKSVATSTMDVTNACMYLAAVIITLFFAIEYAGMAMSMLIMMIIFPAMSVKSNIQRGALSGWVWDVFSVSFTPILDMILLGVPLLMGIMFPEQWLLKIVTCALVIPIRGVAKSLFGMTSAGGGLLNGMMALAALRSGGGMAKRGLNRVAGIGEAVKNAREDKKKGEFHGEMAKAEEEDTNETMKNNGYDAIPSAPEGKNSFGIISKGKKMRTGKLAETFGLQKGNGSADAGSKAAEGYDMKSDGVTISDRAGGVSMADASAQASSAENLKSKDGLLEADVSDESSSGNTLENISKNLNREREDLRENNHASKQKIATLRSKRAELQKKNADLRLEEAESGGKINHAGAIAKNNAKIAGYDQQIAETQEGITENDARISKIDSSLKSMGGTGSGQGKMSARQNAVLQKMANVNNFESPEFSNLSHADKAALYQKRARQNMVKAAVKSVPIVTGAVAGAGLAASGGVGALAAGGIAGGALGSTGSFTGSVVGLGAGMFLGPAAAVNTMNIGSAAGGAVNSVITGTAGRVANRAIGDTLTNPSVQVRYTGSGAGGAGGVSPSTKLQTLQIAAQGGQTMQRQSSDQMPVQISMDDILTEPVMVGDFGKQMNVMDVNAEINKKINANIQSAMSSIRNSSHDAMQVKLDSAMREAIGNKGFSVMSGSQRRESVIQAGASVVTEMVENAMKNMDIGGESYGIIGRNVIMEKLKNDPNIAAMADKCVKEYEDLLRKSRFDVNE